MISTLWHVPPGYNKGVGESSLFTSPVHKEIDEVEGASEKACCCEDGVSAGRETYFYDLSPSASNCNTQVMSAKLSVHLH